MPSLVEQDAPPTQPHEQQQSLLDHVLAKQHLSEQDDEAQDDEASKDGSSLLMSVIQQTIGMEKQEWEQEREKHKRWLEEHERKWKQEREEWEQKREERERKWKKEQEEYEQRKVLMDLQEERREKEHQKCMLQLKSANKQRVVYREVELWNSLTEKIARLFRPRTSPTYQQVAKQHDD